MHQYIDKLREFVNQPRVQYSLMKDAGKWQQLCTCMDTIDDAEMALTAYEAREYGETRGGRYLALYGLLQAAYLQQDSVVNLCDALDMVSEKNALLAKLQGWGIREIRNDSVGHPTKRDRPKPVRYSLISRLSMQHERFTLLTFEEDGSQRSTQYVAIAERLAEHRELLSATLDVVLTRFEAGEIAYKDRFKMDKLATSLGTDEIYEIGKLFDGISNADKAPIARQMTILLRERLHNLEAAIANQELGIGGIRRSKFRTRLHTVRAQCPGILFRERGDDFSP